MLQEGKVTLLHIKSHYSDKNSFRVYVGYKVRIPKINTYHPVYVRPPASCRVEVLALLHVISDFPVFA